MPLFRFDAVVDMRDVHALQRGEGIVQTIGRPRRGDALTRRQECAVDDRQAIVGAVAGEHLFGSDAVPRGGGSAQLFEQRIGVEAQLVVGDLAQHLARARRGCPRALVGVELDAVAHLFARSVALHLADVAAQMAQRQTGWRK